MKKLFLLCLVLFLGACGTIKTNSASDTAVRGDLIRYKTNCHEVSRVYSGVMYDICMLNGNATGATQQISLQYLYVDTVPSVILDTVLLPYTAYKQSTKGNLKIK